MQLKTLHVVAALVVLSIAAGLAFASNAEHSRAADGDTTWNIVIENLTDGQPLSPPAIIVHDPSADVFEVGDPASGGVQAIAETGSTETLVAALTGANGIRDIIVPAGGPILPGDSRSVLVSGPAGSELSVVSMLSCTNDGFTGTDSWALPAGIDTVGGVAYDAGTETNSETSEDIIDGCGAIGPVSLPVDGNGHTAESGDIAMHPGIVGGDDLTIVDHGWTDPVIEIFAQAIPTVTFNVAVDNLTTGQFLSPPVIAAHTISGGMWQLGGAASPGVATVAETGNGMPLLAALNDSPDVYNAKLLGDGPIMPGARAVATFDAPIGSLVSVVSMLGCTNDGFTGINSISTSTTIDVLANAYDAGTEVNTETAGDLTGACGSMGPVSFTGGGGHSPENSVINIHAGIQGGGVLTTAHDWTGPVARIQVTVGALNPSATATPTATTATSTPTQTATASPTASATATATQPPATATATIPAPLPPDTGSGLDGGSHVPSGWWMLLGASLLSLAGATAFAIRPSAR